MFPLVCQLCKEITYNGSLCNRCFTQNYKLNQINNWNIWIKEDIERTNPIKVNFKNEDQYEYVRTLEQQTSMLITIEVMDVLQDIIHSIHLTNIN